MRQIWKTTADRLHVFAERTSLLAASRLLGLAIVVVIGLLFTCPVEAQLQSPADLATADKNLPDMPVPSPVAFPESAQQATGTIRGEIVDPNGTPTGGVHITLVREGQPVQQLDSDEDGRFAFLRIPPGPFQLAVGGEGLATKTVSGTLQPGENQLVPPITLSIATQITQVRVMPPEEVAQTQLKQQEKQRIFVIIPNFYVSYLGENTAPLNARQKFHLAYKATTDPAVFLGIGIIAGMNQAGDRYGGYGQGAEGYAKRMGASFASFNSGLWLGGAVFPSIFKQDPRYFYKGSGTKRSRFLYAISRTFICKGDNQQWQPNYSSVLGDLAAGGLSNLYIPKQDRGVSQVFQNAGISLAASTAINVLEEFVLQKVTRQHHEPTQRLNQ